LAADGERENSEVIFAVLGIEEECCPSSSLASTDSCKRENKRTPNNSLLPRLDAALSGHALAAR
jgi:hypothetical protein